ncbi:hypothetical protein BHE74_00006384 [Ensete ventricosum]|nr:hypothetical protein BHE74_00006384 [Ensete ventricosum]RZR82409.1 hypothetical protein BHM03_00008817 [Ensete ventricosum]
MRFTEGIGKLARNTLGDRRRKTVRLAVGDFEGCQNTGVRTMPHSPTGRRCDASFSRWKTRQRFIPRGKTRRHLASRKNDVSSPCERMTPHSHVRRQGVALFSH